jgi:pilus assembly protein CpaB
MENKHMKSDVKQIAILVMSFLIGLIAFVLTHLYLRGERMRLDELRRRIEAGEERVKVLVANRPLPPGTTITSEDVASDDVPKSVLGGMAVGVGEFEQIDGKKLKMSLDRGEPILWSFVDTPYGPNAGLSSEVKRRLRAVSIPVGGASAVSGHVRPNDRVDVLGTFSLPSKTLPGEVETVTMTVLQNVTVLATGDQRAKDRTFMASNQRTRSQGYNTVTLEVTPHEAELLVFASNMKGTLSLSLRNQSDMGFLDERDLGTVNFDHLETRIPEYNKTRQETVIKNRLLP